MIQIYDKNLDSISVEFNILKFVVNNKVISRIGQCNNRFMRDFNTIDILLIQIVIPQDNSILNDLIRDINDRNMYWYFTTKDN